jgi:hypothetical protein
MGSQVGIITYYYSNAFKFPFSFPTKLLIMYAAVAYEYRVVLMAMPILRVEFFR